MINLRAIADYLESPTRPQGAGWYAAVILPQGKVFRSLDDAQIVTLDEFWAGRYNRDIPVVIDPTGVCCGEAQRFFNENRDAIRIPANFYEDVLFEEIYGQSA